MIHHHGAELAHGLEDDGLVRTSNDTACTGIAPQYGSDSNTICDEEH